MNNLTFDCIVNIAKPPRSANKHMVNFLLSIVRMSGVAKATVYQLFRDKEAILEALVDRKAAKLNEVLIDAFMQTSTREWRISIAAMTRAYYQLHSNETAFDAIFLASDSIPRFRTRGIEKAEARAKWFARFLAEKVPLPYDEQLELAATSLGFVMASITRQALVCEQELADRLIDEAIRIMIIRIESMRVRDQ